jgi:3'(2'), 5'-bisphosphate nucleotidase
MRDARMAATLRRISVEAGAVILRIYGEDDLGAQAKADDSPVTRADLAADAVICDGLAAAFPEFPVVTEERAETHALTGAHFLVDPLDGTKEFIQRRGDFTVNIALVEDGAPVAGVVYAPAKARLFRTAVGGGAVEETGEFSIDVEGPLRPITVATPDMAALRVVASKSHLDPQTQAYLGVVRPAETKSAGSSLKFCLLAAGEADLYPRFGPTMHWDTAAADAVLRAAGGQVLRLPDLTPMRYLGPERRNPGFIATGPFDPPAPQG